MYQRFILEVELSYHINELQKNEGSRMTPILFMWELERGQCFIQ